MPVTDRQQDLEILRELIDCLTEYERNRKTVRQARPHPITAMQVPTDGKRSPVELKRAMLEALEKGLVRLSHGYLGVKLRIAQELAREGRGEEMDLVGLRKQVECALAGAGDDDEVSPSEKSGVGPSTANRGKEKHPNRS